jgi:hypothetical protein
MAEPDRIPKTPPEAQQPPTSTNAELEIVKPENRNDPRYYYLTNPISVDGRELGAIRIDPKGIINGRDWFTILAQHKRKYPEEAGRGNPLHRYLEEGYLSLVIAKLNKITPEDLYKIDPEELPTLFTEARTFQFSGATKQATE